MNTELVQQEINRIVEQTHRDLRLKGRKPNYKFVAQKDIKALEALGLSVEMIERRYRADETVKAVLAAATDAGGKKVTESAWTPGGDAEVVTDTTEPSALYQMLNAPEPTEAANTVYPRWQGEDEFTQFGGLTSAEIEQMVNLEFADAGETSHDVLAKSKTIILQDGFRGRVLRRTSKWGRGAEYVVETWGENRDDDMVWSNSDGRPYTLVFWGNSSGWFNTDKLPDWMARKFAVARALIAPSPIVA